MVIESATLSTHALCAVSQFTSCARPNISAPLTIISESGGSRSASSNTGSVPGHAYRRVVTPVAESESGVRNSGAIVPVSSGSRPRDNFESTSECGGSGPTHIATSTITGSGSGAIRGFFMPGVGSGWGRHSNVWGLNTSGTPSQGSRPSSNVWDTTRSPAHTVTSRTSFLHQAPSELRTAAGEPLRREESSLSQPAMMPQVAPVLSVDPCMQQQGMLRPEIAATEFVPLSQTRWGPYDLLSSGSGSAVSWSVLPPPPSPGDSPPVISRLLAAEPSPESEPSADEAGFRGERLEVLPSFSAQDISAGSFSYAPWGSNISSCSHDSEISGTLQPSLRGGFANVAGTSTDDEQQTNEEADAAASYLEMTARGPSHSLPLPVEPAPAHTLKRNSAPAS